ncbi:LUD domain-containing protein [Pelagibius litoralis]|uniref:LUD domain-containing protein n=2 Tax=Pelagibius litoralis TaxID=374515 RepID=A0A967KE32_9PROT|nr:LUD domain-containing protein [Pelagibius litoralis]
MSGSREQIMATLRRSLKREQPSAEERAQLEARLSAPQPGLIPARGQRPHGEQLDLMEEMLVELSASVVRLRDDAEVPRAVADYLKGENLPPKLRLAPRDDLRDLPWDSQPLLEVAEGIAEEPDTASLTGAFAGIAETGTLMMASGPEAPITLNFLPENHIVVLRASQVVGAYEEAWTRLRQRYGSGVMPRAVNMITGPSRTGDIEQTIQLGAHGPRRLHVILVEDGDAAGGSDRDERQA